MNKTICIVALIIFSVKGMQQPFTTEDRHKVRIEIAKYLLQKKNNAVSIDEQDVMKHPILRSLQGKLVIKEFDTNSACLDDYETKCRYRINLETKIVEEKPLPKN